MRSGGAKSTLVTGGDLVVAIIEGFGFWRFGSGDEGGEVADIS